MSTMLAKLMDRYPIILWLGAALLGKVGGEMMATDPFVVELLNLPHWAEYVSMGIFIVFVCGFSKWIINRQKAKCETEPAHGGNVAIAVEGIKTDGGH
jgi:predicted tellurium resistance membrane protein TerC